jgi:hypothetical protein
VLKVQLNAATRLLFAFGIASAFCVNAYAASAPLPTPVIDSVTPAVITASLSPQTFTITGHDFISGASVDADDVSGTDHGDLVRSATVVSATKITFTVQCLPTENGVVDVRVSNPNGTYSVAHAAMTLQAQLSDLTPVIFDETGDLLHYDPRAIRTVIRAQVTPHSNATLIYGGNVLVRYENYYSSGVLTAVDDDGDGVVAFPALPTAPGGIVFVVVDLSGVMHMTQAPYQQPLPDSTWAPSQPHPQRSTDGTISRYDLSFSTDFGARFLWVRPGVGAWWVYGNDRTATDADGVPFYDHYAVIRTAVFEPLFAADGPPPPSFAPSDVVAIFTYHMWSVERLPWPLIGSTGGEIRLFSDYVAPIEGTDCKVYVRRVAGSEGSVSVSYHTSDKTARAGIDYLATAGTVTFAPGEYVKTISIPTIDDGAYGYGGKYFSLVAAADGATVPAPTQDVFIQDAESEPVISVADVRVNEGDDASGTVQVPVLLSGKSLVTTSLIWQIIDEHQKVGPVHALSFAPGETQKFITITYAGNMVPDPDRTITILLEGPQYATLGNQTATVTIVDDDGPRISVNDITAEEQSETATFVVTMSRAVNATATVRYATFDGTATAPLDYAATSGTLTFAPGEITKTVTVPVVRDQIADPGETFTLLLSDAFGATILKSTGVATILESDRLPQPVVLIDDISVAEGNSGTTDAKFNVRLSFASALPVTVAWRTENGTAHDDSDYSFGIGTLTFAPGETVLPVIVKISGDTIAEPNEVFRVVVLGASNAIAGSGASCTIINDDGQLPPPRHRAAH